MNARSLAWVDWAACANVDAEVFFPTAEFGPVYERQVAAAKAVCAGCRVRVQCLIYARTALPYGIAGGLTEEERRSWTAEVDPLIQHPGHSGALTRAASPSGSTGEDEEFGSAVPRETARRCVPEARAGQAP